jgi:hypothetical protein
VRHFISAMTLTDAGHGDVLGLQRKGNELYLWVNWSHYSGRTRFRDLVRFSWRSGTYSWRTRPPRFKIMPKFGITQTVQAKLDPTGPTSSIASAAMAGIVASVAKSLRSKAGAQPGAGLRRSTAHSCLRWAQHPCAEQHRDDRRECYAIPDEHGDAVFGYESQQPGD